MSSFDIRKLPALWNSFWFESDGAAPMRMFRRFFALLLFVCYLVRSLDLDLWFTSSGLMKLGVMEEFMPMKYRFSLFHYFTSDAAIWIGNAIFLTSLLTLAFGVVPRISALVALVLHLSFLHRNLAPTYGVDMIAILYLFYLCFADYRDRKPGVPADFRSVFGSMAFRLAQIQLCIIYGFSGLHKLKGAFWWKGDGIWSVLANFQMAQFDFTWTAQFPVILTVMSFVSLLWEIYFPALVWVRRIRYPVLAFGVMFHLGIAVTISIPFFGALMIFIYWLFIDASHCRRVENFFKNRLNFIQVQRRPAEENSV